MSTTLLTLNPGTGGPQVPLDDLTTLDGAQPPAGAKLPLTKMVWGPDGDANQTSKERPMPVEVLVGLGLARQLPAGSASANTALTAAAKRVSIFARNANIRYAVGSAAQTASATSHYIAMGERLDFALPATPNIAVLRADTVDGVLEVSELA